MKCGGAPSPLLAKVAKATDLSIDLQELFGRLGLARVEQEFVERRDFVRLGNASEFDEADLDKLDELAA